MICSVAIHAFSNVNVTVWPQHFVAYQHCCIQYIFVSLPFCTFEYISESGFKSCLYHNTWWSADKLILFYIMWPFLQCTNQILPMTLSPKTQDHSNEGILAYDYVGSRVCMILGSAETLISWLIRSKPKLNFGAFLP